MGMFDTVIIEDLKKIKVNKELGTLLKKTDSSLPNDFQTKDLDNVLGTYIIDKNNQVWEERYVPTGKKRPYEPLFKKWKDSRSFLERLYFKIKEKQLNYKYPSLQEVDELKSKRFKSKLTNTFSICAAKEIDNRSVWIDVTVVANNGKAVSFKTDKIEIESVKDSIERIKRDNIFKQNMEKAFEKKRVLASKWYYPIVKEIYNPFVFFSSKIIQYICNKLVTISYRWHGI